MTFERSTMFMTWMLLALPPTRWRRPVRLAPLQHVACQRREPGLARETPQKDVLSAAVRDCHSSGSTGVRRKARHPSGPGSLLAGTWLAHDAHGLESFDEAKLTAMHWPGAC
jgi:hypothetical protein